MQISLLSRKIVRELCSNSRVTITELSEKLGVSRPVVVRHLKNVERELGLKYTLELDYRLLGFNNMHVLYVKFVKKPDSDTLHRFMETSPAPQLVMKTSGDFDMVVFAMEKNSALEGKWEFDMQLKLSKYGVRAIASNMDIMHLGFVPLNSKLINSSGLDTVYKKLLAELNENSRTTIKDLADKLHMNSNMVKYYMAKLVKMGVIRRYTTVVTKPPENCNILFFSTYTFSDGMIDRILRKRNEIYFKREDELPVVGEYQIVASISGGEQDFVWGTFGTKGDAVEHGLNLHKKIFSKDSPTVKYGIVEEVIKGVMPIRSIDIKSNYEATDWSHQES